MEKNLVFIATSSFISHIYNSSIDTWLILFLKQRFACHCSGTSDDPEDLCILCKSPLNDGRKIVSQTTRGVKGLRKAKQARGDSYQFKEK